MFANRPSVKALAADGRLYVWSRQAKPWRRLVWFAANGRSYAGSSGTVGASLLANRPSAKAFAANGRSYGRTPPTAAPAGPFRRRRWP